MKLLVKKGRTSLLVRVFIQDSSSTVGAGLTGLTNASGSLVCYRARDDDGNAGATQITLSGGTRGTWSSGGFKEKDATNMPGWYELGIPDDALVTGSETVSIELKGATNMAPCNLEIQLVAFDPQDTVRLGLTALPNAAAQAAGGLYTRGTGAGQINQPADGQIDVNVEKWNATSVPSEHTAGYPIVTIKDGTGTGEIDTASGVVLAKDHTGAALATASALATVQADTDDIQTRLPAALTGDGNIKADALRIGGTAQTGRDIGASVLLSSGTGTGQLDFTSGVVKANLVQILATALTETAGQIAAGFKKFFNIATPAATMDHLILVDTVTTYTGNTPQTGDAYARLGAPVVTVSADIAAVKTVVDSIKTKTDNLPTDPADESLIIAATDAIQTVVDAVKLKTDNLPSDPADESLVIAATDAIKTVVDAVKLKTDNLPTDPADESLVIAATDAIKSVVDAVKLKTDNLPTDPADESLIIAATDAIVSLIGTPDVTVSADIAAVKADTVHLDIDTSAVWDELKADHTVVDSFGDYLDAKVSDVASPPSAASIADAVWDEDVVDHASAGTFGKRVDDIPTAAENVTELLDQDDTIETGLTVRKAWRFAMSVLGGKLSGAGTGTEVFRNSVADSKNRVTATVDVNGNRTAISTDLT